MKRLVLGWLLVCAAWQAEAQGAAAATPEGAVLRLTLDEAVALALNENPTVRIADMEVDRYDYVKRQTWGNLLPQISASGQYSRSIVKSTMRGGISFGADNTFAVAGDVTLPLFAPQIYRTLKLNRAQMASAVESARATRIDLAAEVKCCYYNILLLEQSLGVLLESERTIQQTVDETQLKYEHGLASEYDLLSVQVQLSNLRPSIIQAQNAIEVATLQLKMYLSVPEEVRIETVGELDAMRDAVFEGTNGLSTDLTDNSTLKQLDLQYEQMKLQLKTANASRLPVVAAFGQASYTGNDMAPFLGLGADGDTSKYFWTHPISVGVQISVPIFAGLTKMNQSRSIKNQMAQLDLQRTYAREQIGVQLRNAMTTLFTSREQMYAQQTAVAQAEKAYSISQTRYNAGAGTMLELNTAQLNLTQARLSYSQTIYDYLSAQAEYDRILGADPQAK